MKVFVSEAEIARVQQSDLAQEFGFTWEQCVTYILSSRKWEGEGRRMREISRLSRISPDEAHSIVVRCLA